MSIVRDAGNATVPAKSTPPPLPSPSTHTSPSSAIVPSEAPLASATNQSMNCPAVASTRGSVMAPPAASLLLVSTTSITLSEELSVEIDEDPEAFRFTTPLFPAQSGLVVMSVPFRTIT